MEKIHPDKKIERDSIFPNVLPPISIDLLDLPINEMEIRKDLANRLRGVFKKMGDEDLDLAVQNGKIPESEANQLYKGLADFISADPNNIRLILYLPFQIMPDLNKTKAVQAQEFAKVLHDGWVRLLFQSEMRASFNDGDDLEPGLGQPARTRKAAHLLPEFLSRGLVSETEVLDILEVTEGEELMVALTEGIVVANDSKFFSDKSMEVVKKLSQHKPAVAFILDGTMTPEPEMSKPEGLNEILSKLEDDIDKIKVKLDPNSLYVKQVSEKRIKWQKWLFKDEAINQAALSIADGFAQEKITWSELEKVTDKILIIRSLRKIGEVLVKAGGNRAKDFAERSTAIVKDIWKFGTNEEKEEIINCVSVWQKLSILPSEFAQKLGIEVVDLSNPLPINLEDFARNDGLFITEIARKIEGSPELSKYFYPFILAFGSKIKGYAAHNGDFDFAVFIKPETPWEKRKEILALIGKEIPEITRIDRLLEYWVNDKDGKLGLKPIPKDAPNIVIGAEQIHFLFGGVWIGFGRELTKFRQDLMEKYLNLERFGDQKDLVRTKLLLMLELDVLQFRIMHKGYRKLYPSKKEEGTTHSNLIDWKSDFWDSGYRQIASLLFLSKVFLPDLTSTK
ncbi:MAG: hypothetical protein HYV90_02390 [Candidatus Woesebacteria bacterium]|nr:MAG: hypothetical protein HYV90_02390 [Candidatus Woesebacteria bacterium]